MSSCDWDWCYLIFWQVCLLHVFCFITMSKDIFIKWNVKKMILITKNSEDVLIIIHCPLSTFSYEICWYHNSTNENSTSWCYILVHIDRQVFHSRWSSYGVMYPSFRCHPTKSRKKFPKALPIWQTSRE